MRPAGRVYQMRARHFSRIRKPRAAGKRALPSITDGIVECAAEADAAPAGL